MEQARFLFVVILKNDLAQLRYCVLLYSIHCPQSVVFNFHSTPQKNGNQLILQKVLVCELILLSVISEQLPIVNLKNSNR
ncbi:hypothetical protein BGP_1894 [Beggiatoa sp. PS]|nr:hypothetical protein BGP_1894 [Beggiatoa sp. PS]